MSPMMQRLLVEAIKGYEKAKSGITVVISEQFARPVLPMIDFGYIIENGMLTLTGTGSELMDNPEVKAAYFGDLIPMIASLNPDGNIFEAIASAAQKTPQQDSHYLSGHALYV